MSIVTPSFLWSPFDRDRHRVSPPTGLGMGVSLDCPSFSRTFLLILVDQTGKFPFVGAFEELSARRSDFF